MKQRIVLIMFMASLVLSFASTSMAVFDSLSPFPVPDDSQEFQMLQGWWNDKLVWFILTETTNIRFSQAYAFPGTPYEDGLTLDYKLASAIDVPGLPRAMGIVINPKTAQAPIFENSPAPTDAPIYSGLWGVFYIKWRAGAVKVPLTSWAQVVARLGTELDYSNVYGRTAIDPTVPWTIVNAPILAVGKLGGPWWPAPPGDPANYRIQQGRVDFDYAYTKRITLPTWYCFAAESISNKVHVVQVIIPDIWDPDATGNPAEEGTLADRLGATWAPGLQNMPDPDTQIFYEIAPTQRPPGQFPVIEEYPFAGCWGRDFSPFSWRNLNVDYSAIMRHFLLTKVLIGDLQRDEGFLKAVIDNSTYIDDLLNDLWLIPDETGYVFNAPVVPPVLDLPQPRPWERAMIVQYDQR